MIPGGEEGYSDAYVNAPNGDFRVSISRAIDDVT